MGGFAWVTLATNDSYSLGALVLAHSLKQVGTSQKLVVMITPGVTKAMRDKLSSIFDVIEEVNVLDSKDETNLRLLKRPELGITFTKLHCWRLTQFEKCVFLDADTLVLENCDELFEREELSAAPDVGWPDCFNSGVFVYRPSNETYEKLVQFALDKGSFDGGDQGLLNMYFSDWAHKDISKHLPFIYNLCSTACYSYLPAFKQFGGKAKIIHFIGATKPWLQYFNTETKTVQPSENLKHLESVLQYWWNIFCDLVHSSLSTEMTRSRSNVVHNNPSNNYPEINPKLTNNISYKSVDHYYNVWDPWEEFDNKKIEIASTIPYEFNKQELVTTKPIESHNTNAYNTDVVDHNFIIEDFNIHNHPEPSIQYSFDQYYSEPTSIQHNPESHFRHDNIPEQNQLVPSNKSNEIVPSLEPKININLNETEPLSHYPVLTNECEVIDTVPNEITLHKPTNNEDETDTGIAGAFAQLTLGTPRTAEQIALDDLLRRQGWEVGNIDYLGKDSFDNIWTKIQQTLSITKSPSPPPSTTTTITPKPKESAPQLKAIETEKETEKTVEKVDKPIEPPKPDPVIQPAILECSLPVTATQKIPEAVSQADKSTEIQTVPAETEIIQKPIDTVMQCPVKSVNTVVTPEIQKESTLEKLPIATEISKVITEDTSSQCAKPESPKSVVVQSSESKLESSKHGPESPKPTPGSPKPALESPKPVPESPKPVPESPKPAPESPKPAPESPKPAPESPKVVPPQSAKTAPPTKTHSKASAATESTPSIPKSTESKKSVEAVSKKADTASETKQATPPTSPVTTTPKKQTSVETAAGAVEASTSSPTPPPRKGSGGTKKPAKPKK